MFRDTAANASAGNINIEKELCRAFSVNLPLPNTLEPNVESALRHVLKPSGSLVHAQLAFQAAVCYVLPAAAASDLAIALEYFHTASLLLGDLPCMDNAVSRRGTPCVHRVYGEATAILASLGFINRAYALTWRAVAMCPERFQQEALAYLEQRLGVEGLLGGQSFDPHQLEALNDAEGVESVAIRKTVPLFQLALVLPALLGGTPVQELTILEGLARCWGLSYQILDDLKDILQSDEESGNSAARDGWMVRPNIALNVGIADSIQRLFQMMDEGDELLLQIMAVRSEAGVLENTSNDLKEAVSPISQKAYLLMNQVPV